MLQIRPYSRFASVLTTSLTRLLASLALVSATSAFAQETMMEGEMSEEMTISGDEVVVPVGQQGADKDSMARPMIGMTSDEVEATFGAPKDWSDPVGEPPITIWHYDEFSVYYEYNRVIHTVVKPNATN